MYSQVWLIAHPCFFLTRIFKSTTICSGLSLSLLLLNFDLFVEIVLDSFGGVWIVYIGLNPTWIRSNTLAGCRSLARAPRCKIIRTCRKVVKDLFAMFFNLLICLSIGLPARVKSALPFFMVLCLRHLILRKLTRQYRNRSEVGIHLLTFLGWNFLLWTIFAVALFLCLTSCSNIMAHSRFTFRLAWKFVSRRQRLPSTFWDALIILPKMRIRKRFDIIG